MISRVSNEIAMAYEGHLQMYEHRLINNGEQNLETRDN